ncbi:hypothetical protein AB0H36_46405 [Kribbella sp. NPDC050820]|uniref:hypothetical protein n=1 Tax=Kribbella sp. NPDC050820 TaxID=3155408 RepID=UPI0033DA4F8E
MTVLQPVHLEGPDVPSFVRQLAALQQLSGGQLQWLPPIGLGEPVPAAAHAVIVPDMTGQAYRLLDEFRQIEQPILVVTSEFGTVSMWDWEIIDYLRERGVATIAPTSVEEYRDILGSLEARAQLSRSIMLAYQDDLGAGMQPDIFKRFYWWEDECVADLETNFGVRVERRSFRALARRAASVSEERVQTTAQRIGSTVPITGLSGAGQAEALRLYLALCDELDETPHVIAAGINCLNESATSPTTPCLAWNLLYEERGLIWGCEADLTSMITEAIVHRSLGVPVMMTNIYPFLMGNAALKHEKIPYFPLRSEPENHILVAHCGFFGVVPQSFATEWVLRSRVLEIVDPLGNAIDARFPTGPVTIVKISSDMRQLTATPAELTGYEQYENSDCLNGAVLRVANGYEFVESTPSHHVVLAVGDLSRRLDLLAAAWGLNIRHGAPLTGGQPKTRPVARP